MDQIREAADCQKDFPAGEPPTRQGPYLLSSEVRPLIDNLLAKNRRTYSLDRRFSFRRPYILLRNSDFSGFFENRGILGWDVFYEKFPQAEGFKALSRIGFNSEMTEGLVYVQSAYTALDTFTTFVLLRKERGEWRRVEAYTCNSGRAGLKQQVP